MTDAQIIDLFFERSEQAIEELAKKHGGAVSRVAYNILGSSRGNVSTIPGLEPGMRSRRKDPRR